MKISPKVRYSILVKIWKSQKLLNSVPFIKKTLVNHFYIRIWSSWLPFKVLQWIKTNFKITQFSSFLLRSGYVIEVKISKKTKTSEFGSIHQGNTCKSSLHSNLVILTDSHSFTVNQDKLQNYSIWRFLLSSRYAILVKIRKWLKLLNSVPFIKKTLVNHLYIQISWSWLTFTVLQWIVINFKISQFEDFC